MKPLPILLFALLIASGCSKSTPEPSLDTLSKLEIGQQKQLARVGEKASIKVLYIGDSRCPSDVTCIWYGYATAIVEVSFDANVFTDTLYIPEYPHLNYFSSKQFQSGNQKVSVTLKDVTPYPCFSCGETEKPVAHLETHRQAL